MSGNTVTTRVQGDPPVIPAHEASELIPADGVVAVSGFGSVGYPKAVPLALASDSRNLELTLISGGSVGKEIDETLVESGAIARRYPYQARRSIRERVNNGTIAFTDSHIFHLGDEVRTGNFGQLDVAIVEAIAVGEDWVIPSTSIGHTPAYIQAADRLIVEINEEQPLHLQQLHDIYLPGSPPNRDPIPLAEPGDHIGSPHITFTPDKLAAVVHSSRRDTPYEFRDPQPVDQTIADNLLSFLESEVRTNPYFADRICLQFGVGSLGNALMGLIRSFDVGDREVIYFGEVIQDGLLDILDAGQLSVASATSLALSSEGQDRLFDGNDSYADDIILRNADISNNPTFINRFAVIGINSALEVDIYGNANSTHLNGKDLVNGIGGSGDFARNSHLSIIALSSTANDEQISRIVPMVPHTDHTEHDIDLVVTEYGVADLRGRSPRERAEAIITECSHPAFTERLWGYFEESKKHGGHIPHDLDVAFTWTNSPRPIPED